MSKQLPVVLITGASSGIGAIYADRFARRGHELVLVARDEARLRTLASRLATDCGVHVDVLRADLTDEKDLAAVEARLADPRIGILVNNAGAASSGTFEQADPAALDALIRLNVTSVTRLARAAVAAFLSRGEGAIINVSSILAMAPDFFPGIYPATKAFVLALSQSLQAEFGPRGIYTQAVLPAATRTEIWERAGRTTDGLVMMDAGELVDAALVGFDRREAVTIPPLADEGLFVAYEKARKALLPAARQPNAAARYRQT